MVQLNANKNSIYTVASITNTSQVYDKMCYPQNREKCSLNPHLGLVGLDQFAFVIAPVR